MLYRLHNSWKTLRNKIAHKIDWTKEDINAIQKQLKLTVEEPSIVNEIAESPEDGFQPHEFLMYYNELESLLDQLEDIPSDSKMDCLVSHLESFKREKKRGVCIVTAFGHSVQYIGASLKNTGKRVFSLTSAMSLAQRAGTLAAFREEGGFLVATDASLEGISLENVDTCINYELPASTYAFEQRIGRFVRFGRGKDFIMVFLTDESGTSPWEERRLQEYRHKFRF